MDFWWGFLIGGTAASAFWVYLALILAGARDTP